MSLPVIPNFGAIDNRTLRDDKEEIIRKALDIKKMDRETFKDYISEMTYRETEYIKKVAKIREDIRALGDEGLIKNKLGKENLCCYALASGMSLSFFAIAMHLCGNINELAAVFGAAAGAVTSVVSALELRQAGQESNMANFIREYKIELKEKELRKLKLEKLEAEKEMSAIDDELTYLR